MFNIEDSCNHDFKNISPGIAICKKCGMKLPKDSENFEGIVLEAENIIKEH